ncbi:MAG: hypothetical protein GXO62_08800 [Epsilonproteobacteria bacterium]|nr:hypothetical protein [Campylobacterota bacterium]
MAEIDKQKEIIGYLKTGFFFFLGTLFGLIAYLFDKYDKLPNTKLIFINIAIVIDISILIFLAKKSKKEIERLKDL